MKTNEDFMRECFTLAKKALGKTTPNPYVGAIIVKDGEILARGYHRKSGEAHAELDAINQLETIPVGCTLYCNLEPCCHENKKTPPCAQRIIKERFKKIVIANLDPNPEVAGKGVALLEQAGIEVITGVLEEEGALLNEVFFTHIQKKRPFIHLKWAQTLDGQLATKNGDSKWITSDVAREHVHRERSLYDGILVGANTARQDNPKLTIRLGKAEACKTRVLLSQSGELPKHLNVFNDQFKKQTVILSSRDVNLPNSIKCPMSEGKLDLNYALDTLYSEGTKSIYVEGGAQVIQSFLEAGLYDRISVYVAPKILGSGNKISALEEKTSMDQALDLTGGEWEQFGPDILFRSQRNVCLQD